MRNPSVAKELHRLFGLTTDQVDSVIASALKGGQQGAYCDIYFQAGTEESLSFDQGQLKSTSREVINGAGVRVVIGDKVGYSFTDHVNVTNLRRAAKIARAIADYSQGVVTEPVAANAPRASLYPIGISPTSIGLGERLALLQKVDQEARSVDPRIENVSVSVAAEDYTIIIANSLGGLLLDRRPLVRLNVSCIARDGDRRESGSSGGGGRMEFSTLAADEMWRHHARTAAKQSIDMLSAVSAPAGEMTVVLGNGWPGVLIHEAVGHGLEGDFNRKGTSAFSTLMGQRVASPLVTVVDDGTMANRRGSLTFDDEGTPTGTTVLIENGILKGYMQDRQNAGLMKAGLTGNGRRESYRHVPMPRMTNTFMAGGQSTREEIIRSVKYGIYAETFGGGQVDITNGDFTFSATAAWLIENGELTRLVKGATLIGNGPKALHNVSMVGNDMALDTGIGTCGKSGQGVPVGVGMPTIRLDKVTVGGSAN
jgi:TldD protein